MAQETIVTGAAVLGAVLAVLIGGLLVRWRLRWRSADSTAHRFATSTTEDRYRTAFEQRKARYKTARKELPSTAGSGVARLTERVRFRYELGSDRWDALVARLRGELAGDPDAGFAVARSIVEDVLSDLRWEAGFWAREAGVTTDAFEEMTVRERFAAALWAGRPNPYECASGHHPRIHLIAAAGALADHAAADPAKGQEAVGLIEDLMEHWFAYAESTYRFDHLDITVAESLVESYRTIAAAVGDRPFPAFLTEVIDRKVTRRPVDLHNKTGRNGDLVPVFRTGSRFSLARLAARAQV
jgi:hypothetical protein